jgi:hypothetical protein
MAYTVTRMTVLDMLQTKCPVCVPAWWWWAARAVACTCRWLLCRQQWTLFAAGIIVFLIASQKPLIGISGILYPFCKDTFAASAHWLLAF